MYRWKNGAFKALIFLSLSILPFFAVGALADNPTTASSDSQLIAARYGRGGGRGGWDGSRGWDRGTRGWDRGANWHRSNWNSNYYYNGFGNGFPSYYYNSSRSYGYPYYYYDTYPYNYYDYSYPYYYNSNPGFYGY